MHDLQILWPLHIHCVECSWTSWTPSSDQSKALKVGSWAYSHPCQRWSEKRGGNQRNFVAFLFPKCTIEMFIDLGEACEVFITSACQELSIFMWKEVEPKRTCKHYWRQEHSKEIFFTLSLSESHFQSIANTSIKDTPLLPHFHWSEEIIQVWKYCLDELLENRKKEPNFPEEQCVYIR